MSDITILQTIKSAAAADLAKTFTRKNRPFGWRIAHDQGEAGTLELHPREQEALKIILDRKASGYSAGMIADDLNEKGLVTQRGAGWSAASVAHVLRGQEAKPMALRAAEGSLTEEIIEATGPKIVTLAWRKDTGKTEYSTANIGRDLGDVVLDEATIAAVERMDEEQSTLLAKARAAADDGANFANLDLGGSPEMLRSPNLHVFNVASRARYASIGAAMAAIPVGVATAQKQALGSMLKALIQEAVTLRAQNVHLRNRLQEVTGSNAAERQAAEAALRDMKAGVLRSWGIAREEQLSSSGVPITDAD